MKSGVLDTTDGRTSPPDGWCQCHLSDILAVIRGVTYKKSDARENPDTGLIGILRATNINGELDFDDLVYVPSKYVNDAQRLRIGDIVVAASSGSRNVVGKAALLRDDWTGSFGAFCYGLRPVQAADACYVAYFLQTTEYRHRVSELSAGININNLQRNHIENMPIRLAPLREQQRIVEEIEKQFTRLDAGVAALKRVEANLRRYKAAVLKAAVEGRLTEKWRAEHPDVEPASELLKRILTERRRRWEQSQLAKMRAKGKPPTDDRWKKKYKEPIAPDGDALPPLPTGWTWTTVEQLTENFDGDRVPVKAEDRAKRQGEYPYYGASGIIDTIDDYLFEGEYLLIAEDGANLLSRSTPIAFRASGQFWVNNHAHVVQLFGGMPLAYLEGFFNSLVLQFHVTGCSPNLWRSRAINPLDRLGNAVFAAIAPCSEPRLDRVARRSP